MIFPELPGLMRRTRFPASGVCPRPAQRSTAKWFKIDQIGKESDGNTWYEQDISAYHSPLSSRVQSHASSTRVNSTHSERQTRLCDTPDPSSSRRLTIPSRDHRPPPSRDTRRGRVLSILHPNPRRWLPNGHPQPNRLLPGRIQ
jgi:hypothetical protein